jgi:hypothetical protein
MHCPTCGKETNTEQKFCRACGMSLEAVSELVTAHSSSDEGRLQKAGAEKAALSLMVKWLGWGLLVVALGILLLLLNKSFILDRMVGFAASCLLLGGTGIATYGVFAALRSGAAIANNSAKPNILPPAKTAELLPEKRIPVPLPSVTERTTNLLAQQDVRKPSE